MNHLTEYTDYQQQVINEEINHNLVLVKKMACSIKKKLPSEIDLNDLIQSGMIGLLEAKKNFDESFGVNFNQYAFIRIKGAMIDFLRKNSWLNKETSKMNKLLSSATDKLHQSGVSHPTAEEMAKELGIDLDDYHKMVDQVNHVKVVNIDDYVDSIYDNNQKVLEEELFLDQIKERIKSIINELVERDQIILSLYYNEELTFKQIAQILNLTEARICQIHSKLIFKIRKQLPLDAEVSHV